MQELKVSFFARRRAQTANRKLYSQIQSLGSQPQRDDLLVMAQRAESGRWINLR